MDIKFRERKLVVLEREVVEVGFMRINLCIVIVV